MTEIIYERDRHRVEVKGHAGCGTAGSDVICSAVSVLVFTLADRVNAMTAAGQVEDATVLLEPGNSSVSCKSFEGTENVITLIFDTICAGFELMASIAPEYISYRMTGIFREETC